MSKIMRIKIFMLIVSMFMIIGCGYKPSSYYEKIVLGDKIYAKVLMDIQNPENSVLVKDAINEAIVSKFKSKIVAKKIYADSQLYVKFNNIYFKPIAYDKDGYIISYKAEVSLDIKYIDKAGQQNSFTVNGSYDFPIEPNSVISDTKKFEAIKFSSYKAISEFVSKISILGAIKKDEKNGKN